MRERERITKRVVDAIKPDKDRTFVLCDKDLTGFRLRVRNTGRMTYEVRYYFGQRERLFVIGDHGIPWTADEARTKALWVLRQVEAGLDPQAAKRAGRAAETIKELIDRYLEEGPAEKPEKRASSWATDRLNLRRHVEPRLGTSVARDLTPADLSRWQKDVSDGKTAAREKTRKHGLSIVRGGKGVAARSMRTLSAMLSWAVRQGLLSENPAKSVAKISDGHRNRFLSVEEATRLWSAIAALEASGGLQADHAALFRLLALTGARRGEILGLRWSEVDFERSQLVLPADRHKAGAKGRGRVIQLSREAVDVLAGLRVAAAGTKPKPPLPLVFPDTTGKRPIVPPKRAWERVRAAADLPELRLHDLRHTFASLLIAEGVPLAIVGKALGHTKAATTERYAHLRDDATRRGADQVGSIYVLAGAPAKELPN
jgi:integrase